MSVLAGFTACDMDKLPFDKIETNESLQTLADCKAFRNDLYADFRNSLYNYLLNVEISADGFNPVVGYSNSYGGNYRWELEASDASGNWQDNYYIIANANLMIETIPSLMETATEEERAQMNEYMGEAYFARALAHFDLTLKYCKDYEPSSAASDLGVPVLTKYVPSADASTYPARSTMEETYKQIVSDLGKATDMITTPGEVCSNYVTVDVVKALKARVALQMHDWATASSMAKSLIDEGKYSLISDKAEYRDMWVNDNGTETIWQTYMDITEKASASGIGNYLIADTDGKWELFKPDYIPESGILDAYDKENDIRFDAYFSKERLNTGIGEVELYLCHKYPGNPDTYTGKTTYYNMQKVFRISEMYLIAAEAYANAGDNESASKMLNDLRKKRIANWVDTDYTGSALMSEIQQERWKELFCEGYRIMDLKRWNVAMKRTPAQDKNYIVLPDAPNGEKMVKEVGDYRFVWPIPQAEIDANPQIRDQQNPGY